MTKGIVFDIQRYSVNDGPGIRTTVFLKGCPLRCPWCHSPESQSFAPQIALKRMACRGFKACGLCMDVCPVDAMTTVAFSKNVEGEPLNIRIPDIETTVCTSCFACADVCPSSALYACGTEMSPADVLADVLKDTDYYVKSGGGVTVSGGEPLCQPGFCQEFLSQAVQAGLTTAVDTSGFVAWEAFASVRENVNLFLYDIKHVDPKKHEQVVGVPNKLILQNARRLADSGARMWIRVPVIPQFNDADAECNAIADFAASLGEAVELVQVLPYHNLGTYKYERIFWRRPIFEAPVPKDERMQEIIAIFLAHGVNAKLH